MTTATMTAHERPKTQQESIELLNKRIGESGLSTTRFAIEIVQRDPRTVRRWLSGDSPIPAVVLDWLVEPKSIFWPPKPGRKRKK